MKNFVVYSMVAICTILVASESTMAVGGGGGGKNTKKACFEFCNVSKETIAVWVRSPGTALPSTLGELQNRLIFIEPDGSAKTAKLKNGKYEITYGFAGGLSGLEPGTPIDDDLLGAFIVGDFTAQLKGKDIKIDLPRSQDVNL